MVTGRVEAGFGAVHDAFAANFAERGDVGASCAVYRDGHLVVDLHGGWIDRDRSAPYPETALQVVFSSTKGAVAACANLAAQRGMLDVDAPVAAYWPEFAQAGKEHIPVRWILSHQGGLPYVDRDFTIAEILDGGPVIEALARQAPVFEPGTTHCYHALTYGWLVGEVIRRVTGTTVGRFFQAEVAEPLGLEFWIGLPSSRVDRVLPFLPPATVGDNAYAEVVAQYMGPGTPLHRAGFNGVVDGDVINRREFWQAEIPAGNGITDARSLARMYAGLIGTLDGSTAAPLLTPAQVDAARTTQNHGPDWLWAHIPGVELMVTYGLGFMTPHLPSAPFGVPGAFGHTGAGGSFGFAHPDLGIAVGYVVNSEQAIPLDPRRMSLVRAVYESVGVTPTVIA